MGVLENGDHDRIDADRYVREDCSKTGGVDRTVEVAVGIVGLGGRRTERNTDDAYGTRSDAVSCVGDDDLVADRGRVSP